MADSLNTPTMSRRNLFARGAAILAVPAIGAAAAISIPAAASPPVPASKLSDQEEYARFAAAMKTSFDPVAYVDYVTQTNDCFAIYRGPKRVSPKPLLMYKCWLTQFGWENCDSFLAELERRNWVYHMLPGEKLWEAEKRVQYLRQRAKIGVYSHLVPDLDGPLLADDVTGSTAFADWERQRTAGRAVQL